MRRALQRRDNALAIKAPLAAKALDRGCHNSARGHALPTTVPRWVASR
jgi:hypothetical protein